MAISAPGGSPSGKNDHDEPPTPGCITILHSASRATVQQADKIVYTDGSGGPLYTHAGGTIAGSGVGRVVPATTVGEDGRARARVGIDVGAAGGPGMQSAPRVGACAAICDAKACQHPRAIIVKPGSHADEDGHVLRDIVQHGAIRREWSRLVEQGTPFGETSTDKASALATSQTRVLGVMPRHVVRAADAADAGAAEKRELAKSPVPQAVQKDSTTAYPAARRIAVNEAARRAHGGELMHPHAPVPPDPGLGGGEAVVLVLHNRRRAPYDGKCARRAECRRSTSITAHRMGSGRPCIPAQPTASQSEAVAYASWYEPARVVAAPKHEDKSKPGTSDQPPRTTSAARARIVRLQRAYMHLRKCSVKFGTPMLWRVLCPPWRATSDADTTCPQPPSMSSPAQRTRCSCAAEAAASSGQFGRGRSASSCESCRAYRRADGDEVPGSGCVDSPLSSIIEVRPASCPS